MLNFLSVVLQEYLDTVKRFYFAMDVVEVETVSGRSVPPVP